MTDALYSMSLTTATKEIGIGALTARALAQAQLARIAATDARIEAWAHLDSDYVMRMAERCDSVQDAGPLRAKEEGPLRANEEGPLRAKEEGPLRAKEEGPLRAKEEGPLRGIGIGVKDIIHTAELPTQMGSPIFAGHQPRDDAECVARLQRAGGYVFGKTVTTALAFLDPGKTHNPWNPAHTPGGSSSGSAAAVAAGHVLGALGTQTNGSVIRPASYCGVVGFKPTKDAIPFAGVNVFSETLDQLGTFTRSVADAARLVSALADRGYVSPSIAALPAPPRLAYLGGFPWTELDCDADDTLEAAATRLRQFGATVAGVEFPAAWKHAHTIHRTIMLFEAARNLASLQERERARLGPKVNAALDEGRRIAVADYHAALAERKKAIEGWTDWLDDFDAVISPSAPTTAPAGLQSTGDPSCCTLWSLTGFPALTIPVGLSEGLPVGMQMAAPAGADDRLLTVAAWCESKLPFRGLLG